MKDWRGSQIDELDVRASTCFGWERYGEMEIALQLRSKRQPDQSRRAMYLTSLF